MDDREGPLKEFTVRVSNWFRDNIGHPTELQYRAWTEVKKGKNALIVSPTGSGKTLSAVLPPVDEIVSGRSGRENTSILYISPMKALGADLMRTLEGLSEGLGRIPGKKERKRGRRKKDEVAPDAFLKVGIRTGDVPQSVRRRMLVDPPDILVVTPENLLLMACSKARKILEDVRYIIVDEVHEMVGSKRGALLALTVEFLAGKVKEKTGKSPQRIGLSATIRPERLAAGYIGGVGEDSKLRDVSIIKEEGKKEVDIDIRTLFKGLDRDEDLGDRILEEVGSMIEDPTGSMVVFHNTRKQAEEMAYTLTSRGIEGVLPHHGSLGPEVRREAEEGLRDGTLKAIISSTSLELGIDIGRVKRVCQISSPKDPGKLLQRLGRSGHGLGRKSLGTIYPRGPMDLLECLAVSRAAAMGQLEKKISQEEPMDVLAQFMTGVSIVEEELDLDRIWDLVRSAYPFRKLKKGDLIQLTSLLTERLPGANQPPPRLWMNDMDGTLHPRRNTKQAFYLNCGTIPKETTFRVFEERRKRVLGSLSRDFGEALYERDVILLGSRPYRVIGFKGNNVIVRSDPEAQPTVPRWTGEVNPRPIEISDHLMEIIESPEEAMEIESERGIRVSVDETGRNTLKALLEHMENTGTLPRKERLPIEILRKGKEKRTYLFHLPMGRKVTEPLGRVLAYGIRKDLGAMVDYIATDDGFAISSPTPLTVDQLIEGFGGNGFREQSKELILSSSMFKTRFSQILGKSLLVLSRFRGKETGAIYRRNRVQSLLTMIMDQYYSPEGWDGSKGPMAGLVLLAREGLNEVMREKVDIDTSQDIVTRLTDGSLDVVVVDNGKEPSINSQAITATWKEGKKGRIPPQPSDEITTEGPKAHELDEGEVERETLKRIMVSFTSDGLKEEKGKGFLPAPYRLKLENNHSFVSIDMDREHIHSNRVESTFKASRPGSVFRALPFFSHPMDIISRSDRANLNDIRSAVRSRRLRPFRIMDRDRLIDPEWETTFISLKLESLDLPEDVVKAIRPGMSIERAEIGEILNIKGNDLTNLMNDLISSGYIASYPEEARFHLGAPRGMVWTSSVPDKGRTPEDQSRAICRFLGAFGPFSLEELGMIFSWPEESIPEGLVDAIVKEDIIVGLGPVPPMVSESSEREEEIDASDIWVWSSGYSFGQNVVSDSDDRGTAENTPLHNHDPALILSGQGSRWIEKEKVKRSLTSQFIIVDPSGERANITILERCDQIIAKDVEFEEFSNLDTLASSFSIFLDSYSRLGYDVMKVEKILGVPAGEAAERALAPFLDSGMVKRSTSKGKILARIPDMDGIDVEKDIVKIMLERQHLLAGHHISHPLQAIDVLGGVTDRWEIMSRIGSSRNQKLADGNMGRLEGHFRERFSSYLTMITEEIEPYLIDWTGILSNLNEDLSDMKDLSKRFGLHRGKMDQPSSCWSFRFELSKFPHTGKPGKIQLSREASDLYAASKNSSIEEWNNSIKIRGQMKRANDLVSSGIAMEDPWGHFIPIERRNERKKKGWRRGVTKGILQRAWIMRCAHALGAFKIEDMVEYTPEIASVSKIRAILKDLSSQHLKRFIDLDASGDIIYHVNELNSPNEIETPISKDNGLVVISPRDRMWRVLSSYMRGALAKGSGFAIFDEDRPIAYLTMKKMAKTKKLPGDEGPLDGRGSKDTWLIKKAWLDPRKPRRELMRTIRRRFFEFGIQVLSEDEKTMIEDLYRDLDRRDEK